MTKKSLPDFLREEAFPDALGNISDTTKEKSFQALPSLQSTTNPRLSRMTKAELEVKVRKLTEILDKTNQQVNNLQMKMSLEEGKILVTTLKLDTQKVNRCQIELEEQKQLVEKLYKQLKKKEEMAIKLAEQQVIDKLKAEVI
ncbi:hypothetical protein [cyanobacterium endosymbiont of Rhopalodia gibberula]|uniref:hypothetical protein n=1 Tax=cyanobacterium endosymbiont of Rhopalodia gibberula TaxID=1763363 RepID=UPI000E64C442|nr:hypothetical protein [cyanobacterium endosymbiont of Rhopalodia gibberula]